MSLMPTEAVVRRPQLRLRVERSRPVVVPLHAHAHSASPLTGNAQVDSNALLRGARELLIQHGGEVYRLRHTRNDKLILTK